MPKVKRALFVALFVLPLAIFAADVTDVAVGTAREEVVAQLGAPKSKLSAGGREIFNYPQGRVVFVGGKVVNVERIETPVPAPASADVPLPSPARAVTTAPKVAPVAKKNTAGRGVWFTDFSAAQAEAVGTNRRMLVLFTGTDWCPPCIEFEAEVAHTNAFFNATRDFVLVKLDYLRNTPQPAAVKASYEALRQRYGVNAYPTFLVISADGAKSSRVDTTKRRRASDIADYFVQAVTEARLAKE
jgi:thiol-disulfide isomerase/thioredoxin